MVDRKLAGYETTKRKPHDVCWPNVEQPDERGNVVRKQFAAVRARRLVRLAMASEVQRHDAIALSKVWNLFFPVPDAGLYCGPSHQIQQKQRLWTPKTARKGRQARSHNL